LVLMHFNTCMKAFEILNVMHATKLAFEARRE